MIKIIKNNKGKIFIRTVVILLLIMMAGLGGALFYGSKTVFDLFENNKKLKAAICFTAQRRFSICLKTIKS